MATFLEIGINLRDNLTRGLAQTQGKIRAFTSAVTTRFKALGASIFNVRGLLGGLAAAFTIRSISRAITGVAAFDDRIGKLSQRLGVSTELLSILRHAGEQSGVEFNALATGVQRMIRRFEEFRRTGKGVAGPSLDALGGGLRQAVAAGATFEELLPRIADRFKELGPGAASVLAGFGLLDTEGVALVQLFNQGAISIRQFADEARRLGIIVSEEDAKAAAEFNDALDKVKKALEGIKNDVIRPLLPELTKLADEFKTFLVDNRDKIIQGVKDIAEQVRALADRFISLAKEVRGAFEEIQNFTKEKRPLLFRLKIDAEALQRGDFGNIFQLTRGSLLGPFGTRLPPARAPSSTPAQDALDARLWTPTPALDELRERLESRPWRGSEGAGGGKEVSPAVQGLRNALEELRKAGEPLRVTQTAVMDLGNSLKGGLKDALISITKDARNAGQALRQLGTTILEAIIGNAIGAAVDFGFGKLIPAAPKQHGGPVLPGRAYVVGERRPELLVMGRQGGYVHPSVPGGPSITINVTASTERQGRIAGRAAAAAFLDHWKRTPQMQRGMGA